MLLLQFQAGKDRFGMDISRVIEVIPMVIFRPLPHADPAVAGLFNYRGTMAPVIDLTFLLTGEASRPLFSTRVILVDYPDRPGQDGERHILGLLAERVTETVFCTEEDLLPAGIAVAEQTRIFEKFYRAATPENEHIPGTGLGLALVAQIIKAHGGEVRVRSAPGEGSTFSLLLPLEEKS